MITRYANRDDLDGIMCLINQAIAYLKDQKIDQWQNGYPNEHQILDDIEKRRYFVLESDKKIIGGCMIDFNNEITYDDISGSWLTSGPYGVIHRIVIDNDYKGQNLALAFVKVAAKITQEKGGVSLRVDTHQDNKSMRNFLENTGFEYCGVITLSDGSPRVAYEFVL